MPKYAKWDIYWANVAYQDDPTTIKTRPVVVNDSGDAYVVAFYVTSQSPKPGYCCYVIKHWQNAGLPMQSNIRLDKSIRLLPSDIKDRIGCLSEQDILFVQLELARMANR